MYICNALDLGFIWQVNIMPDSLFYRQIKPLVSLTISNVFICTIIILDGLFSISIVFTVILICIIQLRYIVLPALLLFFSVENEELFKIWRIKKTSIYKFGQLIDVHDECRCISLKFAIFTCYFLNIFKKSVFLTKFYHKILYRNKFFYMKVSEI